MSVNSTSLAAAAEQLRTAKVPSAILSNGVKVTPEQLDACAGILRAAEPSVITNVRASGGSLNVKLNEPQERPGFIDAGRQEDGVLVFDVGIIPNDTYRIEPNGTVHGLV